jgi:inositol phosphorylceramide mannosyltransferase catalytic subunit
MTIPKIIHQTISNKTVLDDLVVRNIQYLKDLNSDWSYRLYDESERRDFVLKFYGAEMLGYYDRITHLYGAAKADLFRYLALYEQGGVYIDIKSTINKPLDEVLRPDDQYILSHWRNQRGQSYEGWGLHANVEGVRNEYQQWHVIAARRHPFLKAVIEKVTNNIRTYDPFSDGVGKKGVMKLTGPVAYTSAIMAIQDAHPHRLVEIEDLYFQYTIFPPTKSQKFGHEHIGLFSTHYSTQVEPIVAADETGGFRRIAVGLLTQYRLAIRRVRNLLKRAVGRI